VQDLPSAGNAKTQAPQFQLKNMGVKRHQPSPERFTAAQQQISAGGQLGGRFPQQSSSSAKSKDNDDDDDNLEEYVEDSGDASNKQGTKRATSPSSSSGQALLAVHLAASASPAAQSKKQKSQQQQQEEEPASVEDMEEQGDNLYIDIGLEALESGAQAAMIQVLNTQLTRAAKKVIPTLLQRMGWNGSTCTNCGHPVVNGLVMCPPCQQKQDEVYARYKERSNPFRKKT
jgi:hypothetical protein